MDGHIWLGLYTFEYNNIQFEIEYIHLSKALIYLSHRHLES